MQAGVGVGDRVIDGQLPGVTGRGTSLQVHQDLSAGVLEFQHHRLVLASPTADGGDLVVDGIEPDGGQRTQGDQVERGGAGDALSLQVDVEFELEMPDVDRAVAGGPQW